MTSGLLPGTSSNLDLVSPGFLITGLPRKIRYSIGNRFIPTVNQASTLASQPGNGNEITSIYFF